MSTTQVRHICCAAVVGLLMVATIASAQSIFATLTGTVSDASAAVIPNANVTLTNESTRDVRKTTTNAEGYFTFAAVPVGSYTVTVEAPGFKGWERTGVTLGSAEKRNIADIIMQLGATGEKIEVVSAQDLITPVDSGEKSATLNTKQLQDFSVVGRSAAEFIKILPGMAQTGNGVTNRPGFSGETIGINGNGDAGHQSALGYYSANGTPPSSMDITSDGAHVSDPGCNCATPVNPNTDMIQEFKVLTSNFSAENSKGPVVLNSIAKSGTKDFHGLGYFYARHYALNSNDWQQNKLGVEQPKNKYFFPGANIGGPVLIPGTNFNKNRDKLFFFTGFEYYYQTLDTGLVQASVPTQAMRDGNFSAAEVAKMGGNAPGNPGPVTDAAFQGGIIPKSAFDKGGQALMNLYPLPNIDPNIAGGFNYVKSINFNQNSYQWMSRVDYSISDNTKLFVRYNLQNELQLFPVSLWWRPQGGLHQVPYPTPITAHNQSQSVSASLTSVLSPSLTNEFVFGYTYIDFPNSFDDPKKVDRTALGYPYQGLFKNGVKQIPAVGAWGNPTSWAWNPGGFEAGPGGNNLFAIKHLASFSDNVSKVYSTHTMKFGFYGEYNINNQPANGYSNGFVHFATGHSLSSGNAYADMLLGRAQGYDEQNFNNLHNEGYKTYEFFAQDSWKVSRRLTLDFGMRFQHLGNWYDRQGVGFAVFNPAAYKDTPTAYLPGITWNKINSSVANTGQQDRALFYAPRFGMAWDIFGSGKTVLRGGWGAFRFHSPQDTAGLDAPTGSYQASIPNPMTLAEIDQFKPAANDPRRSNQTVRDQFNDQAPLTYSYSFSISQRLPFSSLLEVSYVGNQSKYLTTDRYNNLNAVPYGTLLNVPSANDANYDAYRPLSYYQDLRIITNRAYQNYNGLQVSWNRTRGRYNVMFNYTWSKTMGIVADTDQFNIDNNYGPMPYDRRHIFNAAYSVELGNPIHNNAFGGAFLNGWQVSGITQISSGANLQGNYDSAFNMNVPSNGPLNLLSAKTVNGTSSIKMQPVLTCDPRSNLGTNQYINANCFALPSPGHNGSIIMPEMFGPGFFNSDLGMFKNFQMGEQRKLQFRFNAYNFLNHPVWSFGSDNNLNLAFNENGKVSNTRFGYVDNKLGRRVIQLAVKYYF